MRFDNSPRWPVSPYKGLGSYTEEDAPLFAGRNEDIRRCAATLAEWKIRLLLLHGSTGCGKSSFLRAGLIPHLENASIGITFARAGGRDRGPILLVRSTAEPLAQLADALYRFAARHVTLRTPDGPHILDLRKALPDRRDLDVTEFLRRYGDNPEALLGVLENLSRLVPETLVLIIDQGEEVLTVDNTQEGERWRTGFFRFLSDFADAQFDLKLVIALRTEYLGRFTSRVRHGFRGPGVTEYFLDELNERQIKEAVLRPTVRTNGQLFGAPFDHYRFSFDDGVVDKIIEPLGRVSGGKLAALQIVCTELYKLVRTRPEPRHISVNDLQSLGGVEGSIERFLDDQLLARGTAVGLTRADSEQEAIHWKEVLHGLVRVQPDGTVTTDLKPESDLRKELSSSRLNFTHTVEYLTEARLLREVDVVEVQTGELIRCFGLGHDTLGLVLRNWKSIGDLFVEGVNEKPAGTGGAQELAARVSAIWIALDNSIQELLRLEETVDNLSREIQECSYPPFDFVAIQIKNREEQTIETVHGSGLSSDWVGLAKHTIQGDPELLDIQADIVMSNPPRIEIISGRDDRFDNYIFTKFNHLDKLRVFVPIILAPAEVNLEDFRWNVLEHLSPNVKKDRDKQNDRRTVLAVSAADWGQQSEVIGTVEAGFDNSSRKDPQREIPRWLAIRTATIAGKRASDLHRASLENVFRTIARCAMRMISADAASLHFARIDNVRDTKFAHYTYEAWEGRRFDSITSPRSNGLGQQALQKRKALFVPDKELGQDEQYLREFHREAYDAGMRAEAAIPIFFSEESDVLYADADGEARKPEKQGLLYVRFDKPHHFTRGEIAWLELLAARAIEAIRQATYYTRERERARRLANIQSIAASLAQHPASPFLLQEIAGAALNILAADIVSVYEYDQQKKRLISGRPTTAGRLIEPDLVTADVDEISAPALLLKSPENIYADDAEHNSILAAKRNSGQFARSFVARERIKSTAALILTGGTSEERGEPNNEILGLMFVNYRSSHHFTVEDRRVAETLASTAAIAIRNGRIRSSSRPSTHTYEAS